MKTKPPIQGTWPFADRLRRLVDNHRGDQSYAEFARSIGMKRQQLSLLLVGRNPNPKTASLTQVLAPMGLTAEDFWLMAARQ